MEIRSPFPKNEKGLAHNVHRKRGVKYGLFF
jgi:hypothetical protein